MRSTTELLHRQPIDALSGIDKDGKNSLIHAQNIFVNARSVDDAVISSYVETAEQLGFTSLELRDVFFQIATHVIQRDIVLPKGKRNKKKRGLIIDSLLLNAQFVSDEERPTSIVFSQDNSNPLKQKNIDIIKIEELAEKLLNDSAVIGRVASFIKLILKQRTNFLIIQQHSTNLSSEGVHISAENNIATANKGNNTMDHAITSSNPDVIRFGLLRESLRQIQYDKRRQQLVSAIQKGEIKLLPRFEFHNWPTDHLMQSMRMQVAKPSSEFIFKNDFLCDPQDLKYQVLFRLTTYPVSQVFEQGEKLERYLQDIGAYEHWNNILNIDSSFVSSFNLNPNLLNFVMREQAKIITDRLAKSSLPIQEILTPSGIFTESGWVIAKRKGDVLAVQEEGSAHSDVVVLDFCEINPDYAQKIHGDLHYIHTPRADKAFGLFIKGENIPFSVLALDKIDRAYKQNALLAQGYDPRRCYDLTRLYNRPGTPGNTSSSIFALTFQYLREQYSETQAVVSAFMPSYATGVSMTSGGFDNPIMIKTLRHTFSQTITSDGSIAYEHLTRRRHASAGTKELITNKFPLLPTIELMTKLKKPRFEPLLGLQDNMIEIEY